MSQIPEITLNVNWLINVLQETSRIRGGLTSIMADYQLLLLIKSDEATKQEVAEILKDRIRAGGTFVEPCDDISELVKEYTKEECVVVIRTLFKRLTQIQTALYQVDSDSVSDEILTSFLTNRVPVTVEE